MSEPTARLLLLLLPLLLRGNHLPLSLLLLQR